MNEDELQSAIRKSSRECQRAQAKLDERYEARRKLWQQARELGVSHQRIADWSGVTQNAVVKGISK